MLGPLNKRISWARFRPARSARRLFAVATLFCALSQALAPLHALAAYIGGGTDVVPICSGSHINYIVLGADGVPIEETGGEPCEHCCLFPQAGLARAPILPPGRARVAGGPIFGTVRTRGACAGALVCARHHSCATAFRLVTPKGPRGSSQALSL